MLLAVHCAPRTPSNETVAITHVGVVDVETGDLRDDQTVLIQGDRIVTEAASDSTSITPGTRVIDASNQYVIPGLWDAHVHLSYLGACALPVLVANGITAVRDAGARIDEIQAWRSQIGRGELAGPFLTTAGPNIESSDWLRRAYQLAPPDHPIWHWGPRIAIDGPAGAPRVVDSLARLGVDFVKFRNVPRETFLAIGSEARRRGLPLAGHAPRGALQEQNAAAGTTSLEHAETITLALGSLGLAERREVFAELARRDTHLTPTLITMVKMRLTPDSIQQAIVADSGGVRDPYRRYVSTRGIDMWSATLALNARAGDGSTEWEALYQRLVADMRLAHAAGVPFLAGTDMGSVAGLYPGASLHEELELLVRDVGLTPLEALRSATIEPSAYLGLEQSRGVIAPGAVADLVLLDANPLTDIANTRRIEAVVANGRVYQRADLDSLLSDVVMQIRTGTGCDDRSER